MSASAAALEAARLRFRPIIMTSLAFILGVTAARDLHRRRRGRAALVGTGVMGGMLAATFLAIFFVPMFFKVITARRLREPRSTEEIQAEAEHVHAHAARPGAHHLPSQDGPAGPRCPAWKGSRHEVHGITDAFASPSRVAAAVLAGCAVPPAEHHETPQLELPAAAPASDGAADWWKSFNDPRLDALVVEALANNRDLARAMARIDESRAVLRSAKANQLPRVDANASAQPAALRRERTADDRGNQLIFNDYPRQPERRPTRSTCGRARPT